MSLAVFPRVTAGIAGKLPKTFAGSISRFFSGTSGSIAKTSLKVGGGVAGGGILASIGLSSLASSFDIFDEQTGFKGSGLLIVLAVIGLILFLVLRK